jgi:hypothetical protein
MHKKMEPGNRKLDQAYLNLIEERLGKAAFIWFRP